MTSARRTTDRRALDPDALAALEEERDFLLRSLDDLERERDAGDLTDDDYVTLRDDYTARAAAVLRALDDRRVASQRARAARRRPLRTLIVVVLVGLGAVGSGLLVANLAGDRTATGEISGSVPLTTGQRLAGCLQLANAGQILEALQCYDEILAEQPANAEALTYRGWSLVLAGLAGEGWRWLDAAVAADPEFPDARAFRGIVLNAWCRPEEAIVELDALDAIGALPEIQALVEGRGIRAQSEALLDARAEVPAVAEPPPPADPADPAALDQCGTFIAAGVLEPPG
ncbi:MAG TPA: hypothetical protein VK866_16460 [Acidimicrobiales bacterium]|nr:hypothetical protein [Acidimicrobiales bacterium]